MTKPGEQEGQDEAKVFFVVDRADEQDDQQQAEDKTIPGWYDVDAVTTEPDLAIERAASVSDEFENRSAAQLRQSKDAWLEVVGHEDFEHKKYSSAASCHTDR